MGDAACRYTLALLFKLFLMQEARARLL